MAVLGSVNSFEVYLSYWTVVNISLGAFRIFLLFNYGILLLFTCFSSR